MSVEVNGKNVFTKEMARVFETEVIECPDCGFAYATIHFLDGNEGLYECPCCNEQNLFVGIYQLTEKLELYEKALTTIMKDSELSNGIHGKASYSYPGKIAKNAIEGKNI